MNNLNEGVTCPGTYKNASKKLLQDSKKPIEALPEPVSLCACQAAQPLANRKKGFRREYGASKMSIGCHITDSFRKHKILALERFQLETD